MTAPVQLAPFLTATESDGEYLLRVDGSPLAQKISAILAREIGSTEGARKLTLITPTDLKVFKLALGAATPAPAAPTAPAPSANPLASAVEPVEGERPSPPPPRPPRIVQDGSAPPSPEYSDYEREMAEAARIEQQMTASAGEVVEFPPPAEETPAPARRRRQERPTAESAPATACGRCGGAGEIAGGGRCPVCSGRGAIAHFGHRGRR